MNVLIGECDSNKSHNHTTSSQSTSTTGGMSANESHSHNVIHSRGEGNLVYYAYSQNGAKGARYDAYTNGNITNDTGSIVTDSKNLAHIHNFAHTHGISNSGSVESKPINLTTKLWRRIA